MIKKSGDGRMIANTHRLVGEFLYKELPEELQCRLSRRKFVFGNVKPDLKKKYRQFSHYYRDNQAVIFKWLDIMIENDYEIEEFSEKLGILIHFFCDYTCIYHANDYLHSSHSIRQHIQYEGKLHLYAARQLKGLNKMTIIPFQNQQEIYDYVANLTRELNQESAVISVEKDFENMMMLSTSVLLYILNHKYRIN